MDLIIIICASFVGYIVVGIIGGIIEERKMRQGKALRDTGSRIVLLQRVDPPRRRRR